MHRIEMKAGRRLLVATCIGFWSDDDQQAFDRALMMAIDGHRPSATLDLMFDVTAQPVQSPSVVDRQRILSVRIAERGVRRIAIVVTSQLLTNQLTRVRRATETGVPTRSTEVRYFTDRVAAERWLTETADRAN